ncbi:hypothetical protein SO802_015259, partial [Lithocarpus litseifolius]
MDDFDFTITLCYWGNIRNNPYRYEGGEIKIYEDNNSDDMSLVEIWNKAKNFGYGENDVFMYIVPTMPFVGDLKPLENDVDVMNMVKFIRGYNEVEVYVMFLDDYENAIGNEGDGEDGDNEEGNHDEGDKVDGAVSEEDSAHKVHFGCNESDDDDMFAQYISSGEIASKVKGLPDETLCLKKDKQVKLKEGRKGKASACRVSPGRVDGSGVDPSGVGQSKVGASGVGPSRIDARGVDPTWVDASGVNPSAGAFVAFGADRDEDKWESETSASLMKDEDTWIVKKLNPKHNCGRRFRNRFSSSNWLGKHLVDDARSDPNVKMSIIKDRVVNKFKVHISRPFIGVDGCHLKGEYPGQILIAVGKDGNNGIYPIAFAVVETETKDSWTWFMKRLLDDIGSLRDEGWTFMSDQQKGLTQMFDELMPGVDHQFCVRHLYNSFSRDYKGKEPRFWTRAAFRRYPRCDAQTNNGCENFNSLILEYRDEPIITMLEEIRLHQMAYYIKKKEKMARYHGPICPRIQNKLETGKINSTDWVSVWCGDSNESKFKVSNLPGNMEFLAQTYKSCVYTINGPKLWPQSGKETILTPKKVRQGGRPKKKRKKEPGELNNPYKMKRRIGHVKCSQCGKVGDDKRRCNPAMNKSAIQASKQQRVREPNVTTQSLEDQDHRASSSHVEPANEAAHPSQTSHEAHANQHNEKLPVTTTQSQPASQCEGVHRTQPTSQVMIIAFI